MRMFKKNYFLIGLLVSFGMTQHFNLNVEPTGQFQLVIFEESISLLEENDEIGIFDSNGVIESCYPDDGCTDPLIGEVLVGTGRWANSQLSISSVMSLDLSDFGGPTLNGAVNDNPIIIDFGLSLNMNDQSIEKDFSWELDENSYDIYINTSINVFDWGAEAALNALNEVCLEQHTGPDGVNKLWPDVDITVIAAL